MSDRAPLDLSLPAKPPPATPAPTQAQIDRKRKRSDAKHARTMRARQAMEDAGIPISLRRVVGRMRHEHEGMYRLVDVSESVLGGELSLGDNTTSREALDRQAAALETIDTSMVIAPAPDAAGHLVCFVKSALAHDSTPEAAAELIRNLTAATRTLARAAPPEAPPASKTGRFAGLDFNEYLVNIALQTKGETAGVYHFGRDYASDGEPVVTSSDV